MAVGSLFEVHDDDGRDERPGDPASARWLEAWAEACPVGAAIFDGELRYLAVNDALARMTQLPRSAHLGRVITDVLPTLPADVPRVMREVLDGGAPVVGRELAMRLPGAKDGHWLASYHRVELAPGRPAVAVAVEEVTTRKRAQAHLELLLEAKALLTSSLDTHVVVERLASFLVPKLASFCEIDLVGDDGAPRPVTIAHVDPEKAALGRELRRRYPSRADRVQGVVEVVQTGRSQIVPEIHDAMVVAIAEDDEHLRALRALEMRSSMIVPMTVRDRTIGALSLISTDPDRGFDDLDLSLAEAIGHHAALALDHARLYEAERRARIEAERANRAKDEFLGVVSHELRTPLNAIFGWANMLRAKAKESPLLQKGLEVIERNARAQARIVEDILDVSRIISGKLTLELRPVQLDPILAAAIEVVRPPAEAKGITLDVRVEAGLPAVAGDPDRLQQVLWNLLSNAVKFTPEGGRVEVVLARDGGDVRVTVTDTGAGIDPAFLPFVFERFQQADSSTQRRYGGLGLGLAIVRHLIDLHGGRVAVASDGPERGACFTVRLPIPAERALPAPKPGPRRSDTEPPPEASALAGLKALAVDDDPDALELLTRTLSAFGVLVYAASSAGAALHAFDDFDPEVVISDIGMPGEDGYSMLRRIRDLPRQKGQIPAIALTAYARGTDAESARAAGFQAHLAKPIDTTLLCMVLASVTGRLRAGE